MHRALLLRRAHGAMTAPRFDVTTTAQSVDLVDELAEFGDFPVPPRAARSLPSSSPVMSGRGKPSSNHRLTWSCSPVVERQGSTSFVRRAVD